MAATSAIALSAPMPWMIVSRRAFSSVRAYSANSASGGAMRWSRNCQRWRTSATSLRMRGVSVQFASVSSNACRRNDGSSALR